jgi:predicted DNA-binding transcriptional regulator AlpA
MKTLHKPNGACAKAARKRAKERAATKKKYIRGKHPNSHLPHKPKELAALPPLSPNEVVRWIDGPRYFGFQHTQMQLYIKTGEIPKPIALCGPRSKGWLGETILAWQRKRAEKLAGSS